jgi:hypothetical protein
MLMNMVATYIETEEIMSNHNKIDNSKLRI